MKEGPVTDPDSFFAAVDPSKTHAVMEALRKHKIEFSVSVNPRPGEGEAECDVFWFWRSADIEHIQRIIYEAQSRPVAAAAEKRNYRKNTVADRSGFIAEIYRKLSMIPTGHRC